MVPSKHMKKRCQQRGIKGDAVKIVRYFGVPQYSQGGVSYSMNKQSRERAKAAIGDTNFGQVEKHLNIYVIESLDRERILTVAHRLKR